MSGTSMAEAKYTVTVDKGWSYVVGPSGKRHPDPWRYQWEAQEFADALNARLDAPAKE